MTARLRILHLEDDVGDAELIHAALESDGIVSDVTRVDTQAGFRAALAQRFDVVLADNTLPGFDGLTALKLATEACPDVPFIFVSGTLGEEVAIEARSEEHTSELQSHVNLVCRLLLEKKK